MRTTAIFLLAALLISPVWAQQAPAARNAGQSKADAASALPADAPSNEQLMKLFGAMEIQKQMTSMMNAMGSTIEKMMPPNIGALSDKQKGQLAQLQTDLLTKMMTPAFMDAYIAELIPIYQKHFTKGEVDGLISFYASPVGQKFLREQPQLTQESLTRVVPMMQKRVQVVMDEIKYEQRMKEIFGED
jgi:uncharacterized protein